MKPSRWASGVALVGATVLMAVLVSSDDGSASAAAAQRIAFIRSSTDPGGARVELYVINADGSGERRLVETARVSPTTETPYELASEPAWSPDGRKIAYVGMADDGNTDVYVVGADGLGRQRLTRHPKVDGNPAWSPDGRKIAFTRGDRKWSPGQKAHIYVMNADGSKQRRLAHGEIHFSVAWSPDGKKMLFERPNPRHPAGGPVPGDANEDLHVMNADGSGQRNLTRNPADERAPAWSPDGRRVAFTSGQIWLMNPNGSGKRSLTPAGWRSGSPDWSPDGRKIAFSGRPSTPPRGVFVMNADGSERRRLAQDGSSPAWSPDGQMIAFDRDDEIYVMNADGSGKRRLLRSDNAPGPGGGLPWAWSPAQK